MRNAQDFTRRVEPVGQRDACYLPRLSHVTQTCQEGVTDALKRGQSALVNGRYWGQMIAGNGLLEYYGAHVRRHPYPLAD